MLVTGLSVVAKMEAIELEAMANSQVVVNQVLGLCTTKGVKLNKYFVQVWELCDLFSYFNLTQIPRVNNKVVDKLNWAASGMDKALLPWPVIQRIIEVPTIGAKVSVLTSAILEWASGVAEYLIEKKLPETREKARRIKRKPARFLLIDGVLYKRGFSTLLLRCISIQEA